MKSKKYTNLVNITKKKQADKYGEQTSGYQWEGGEMAQKKGNKRYKLLGIK